MAGVEAATAFNRPVRTMSSPSVSKFATLEEELECDDQDRPFLEDAATA